MTFILLLVRNKSLVRTSVNLKYSSKRQNNIASFFSKERITSRIYTLHSSLVFFSFMCSQPTHYPASSSSDTYVSMHIKREKNSSSSSFLERANSHAYIHFTYQCKGWIYFRCRCIGKMISGGVDVVNCYLDQIGFISRKTSTHPHIDCRLVRTYLELVRC